MRRRERGWIERETRGVFVVERREGEREEIKEGHRKGERREGGERETETERAGGVHVGVCLFLYVDTQ